MARCWVLSGFARERFGRCWEWSALRVAVGCCAAGVICFAVPRWVRSSEKVGGVRLGVVGLFKVWAGCAFVVGVVWFTFKK